MKRWEKEVSGGFDRKWDGMGWAVLYTEVAKEYYL